MALTLKEESIVDQWCMILDRAAGHGDFVLQTTQTLLAESRMPGNPRWSIEEVKSSTWIHRVRREFLYVIQDDFKDYKTFIGARDYGIHLDVCRFLTVEPGFLKRLVAEKLTGDKAGFSAGANILKHQDLVAYVTVVHHCLLDAVEALMKELGQNPARIDRKSKGFLEVW